MPGPVKGTPRAKPAATGRNDPEALAAFYRHRSESLRRTTTVAPPGPSAVGIVDYLMSALQGKPERPK